MDSARLLVNGAGRYYFIEQSKPEFSDVRMPLTQLYSQSVPGQLVAEAWGTSGVFRLRIV